MRNVARISRTGGLRPELSGRLPVLACLVALAACSGNGDGDGSTGPGPTLGSVQVTASTAGEDPDPDGYTITLDGGEAQALGANATTTFADVEPGDHEVELGAVAANCAVQGDNPRTVAVTAGATAEAAFEVACIAPLRDQIVFQTDRDDGNVNLYVMAADGSGDPRRLTVDPASETHPAVSPDGLRIAFMSDRDGNQNIYVMRADGSEWMQLTEDLSSDSEPAWSPDASKIAFTSDRDGGFDIFVIDADGGSSPEQLTNNSFFDTDPAWSPDGSKIAFRRNMLTNGGREIWVMNADGSNSTSLTDTPDVDEGGPAWSPDGQTIAFHANHNAEDGDGFDIYLMGPNGEDPRPRIGVVQIDDVDVFNPTWSPDGTRIAFEAASPNIEFEISVGGIGGGVEDLFGAPPSPHPASDRNPAWSP